MTIADIWALEARATKGPWSYELTEVVRSALPVLLRIADAARSTHESSMYCLAEGCPMCLALRDLADLK